MQNFYFRILKTVTRLVFFNINDLYQGWNIGCFWWNFSNINPTCCTYQYLCKTFTNVFHFLINCWTSWKCCEKQIKSLSSNQLRLNFWNRLHPNLLFMPFVHKTDTWRPKPSIFCTSSVKAILKAITRHGYLWASLRGAEFLIYSAQDF